MPKEEEFEYHSAYDTDSETEESCDECTHDFLRTCIFENDHTSVYVSTARDFIPSIRSWGAQRSINEHHVDQLAEQLKTTKRVIGSFKLIVDKNDEARCIDGQHRILALQKIMRDDVFFDIDILLEVYSVDALESEEAAKLFRAANNTLNISDQELPEVGTQLILSELNKNFPGFLVDPKTASGRVNRPRINKRILCEALKPLAGSFPWRNIYKSIISYNTHLGMTPRKRDCSKTVHDKAKQGGFYLGTMKDPLEWIPHLRNLDD
tara:strand:- start:3262 stop:4056 length:795 start_codon:yes stop_codon:yes gene_type:complete